MASVTDQNDVVKQFDAQLITIKGAVEQKMNDIESKLKNIDGFAIKMDNMFKMIETNDTNIKLEVANKFQKVEQELTMASQAQRAMVGA